MKKSVYLTILTIVTVICIIAGSCYHILGWGISLMKQLNLSDSLGSEGTIDAELDDFDTLYVDANVMSLEIVPGNHATISYEGSSKLYPTYEINDGTLTLTQETVQTSSLLNSQCSVTITVPRDTYFTLMDIDIAAGDIDLYGLAGAEVTLDAAVGDIDIESCDFDEMSITADVGDVDVDSCTFITLCVENSVGDIDVECSMDLAEYSIDMSTDIGDVEYNDRDYRRSFSQDGSAGSVTLRNDTGDVSLDCY